MSPELDRLVAEQAIVRQLHHYARSMDRCDTALGRAVFHEDSIVDYGEMFQGSGYDFVDFALNAHQAMTTHVHCISNIVVTVSGDRGGSESYVQVRLRLPQDKGYLDLCNYGRYIDEWERREGSWRIARRRYIHEMDAKQRVESGDYPCHGRRDLSDASYGALSLKS